MQTCTAVARAFAEHAGTARLTPAAARAVDFDVDNFVRCLRHQAATDFVPGRCVHHLHRALVLSGADAAGRPLQARQWGPFLWRIGFRLVACDSFSRYAAQAGDVAVVDGTRASADGHVQGFDGAAWVSDSVQPGFWPSAGYRRAEPSFEIYRPRRPA